MATYYVLSNPKSGNGRGNTQAHRLDSMMPHDELIYIDVTQIADVKTYISMIPSDAHIILCGGDGTLNHFVNDIGAQDPGRDILFFGTGSGNDFLKDIGRSADMPPVLINPYIVNLPQVTVNGMTRYYLNGIGYGIDGYCCEEGDKIRATSTKPVNYTSIAIKGLLFGFHRVKATVTVDNEIHSFKHVWLAPCMKGRYFGGGMMCAPQQNRLDETQSVSVMVMKCVSKLYSLICFPSIFKGTHVKHKSMICIFQGHHVHVSFDKPCALQIDGETVLNVHEYTVSAGNRVAKETSVQNIYT